MKLRAILLTLMIGYQFYINASLTFGYNVFRPTFPLLYGFIGETIFWTVYTFIQVVLAITLLGGATIIKTKYETHIHEAEKKEVKVEKPSPEVKQEKEVR